MSDGLCRLTPLPSQSGSWQVFMMEAEEMSGEGDLNSAGPLPPDQIDPPLPPAPPQDPEIMQIQLHKVNRSMGLSIVAAKVCTSLPILQ